MMAVVNPKKYSHTHTQTHTENTENNPVMPFPEKKQIDNNQKTNDTMAPELYILYTY